MNTLGKVRRMVLSVLTVALVLGAAGILSSCTTHSEGGSITTLLDSVDFFVSQGDTTEALGILKKADKQARTSYERLGVYKRYLVLGESARAEKVIKKAIRKEKGNTALVAVYSAFLARQGRTKEALRRAEPLSGTRYGSLYAEVFLRTALQGDLTADELFAAKKKFRKNKKLPEAQRTLLVADRFYDQRFIPVYRDAFAGTRLSLWARNAAVLSMMHGDYATAVSQYPGPADTLQDSLFWGCVLYDAGRYTESMDALRTVPATALQDAPFVMVAEHQALLSDIYYLLGEEAEAERLRGWILAGAYGKSVPADGGVLPGVYVNSALYSRKNDDRATEYGRLHDVLALFPRYEPALAAYGEFALASLYRTPDDKMTAHIRASGLQTRKMEEEAAIPVVQVEDVLALIQAARLTQNSPRLVVLDEQLRVAAAQGMGKEQRVARIWPLLENNEIVSSVYPEEIIRYAVLTMLENGFAVEAETTFDRYVQSAFSTESHAFVPVEHPEQLSLWACEVAAWFAVNSGRYSEAATLYQHIVDKYAARNPAMNASGQNTSVMHAYMNLGNIYAGSGQALLALDYLNKASARADDAEVKAEILYRMGKESFYLHDYHTAARSLQYAIKLNPSHNKARLSLMMVQQAQNE